MPDNHVTRELAARAKNAALYDRHHEVPAGSLPVLEDHLIAALERCFPPRCWDPRAEPEADHHAHRGKVELVEALRANYEASAHGSDRGGVVEHIGGPFNYEVDPN